MTDEKDTKENKDAVVEETKTEEVKTETVSKSETTSDTPKTGGNSGRGGESQKREFTKNRRNPRNRRGGGKPRSEFEQKILDIRRVTRVSKGGRRFSFAVSIVVGNKKGKIGVGTGKAGDTSLAIDKAVKDAQNRAITVKTTKTMSIPHDIDAKFNSARVVIMPAPGRGIIAGSALRDIIELGGLNDINGKIISGSKNKLNIARAVVAAFESLNDTVADDDKILSRNSPKKDFKSSRSSKSFKPAVKGKEKAADKSSVKTTDKK
jgi:small subunit ribosomal protein S5